MHAAAPLRRCTAAAHRSASRARCSGQKLEMLDTRIDAWDPATRAYLQSLAQTKQVVLTGDLNVAHRCGWWWLTRQSDETV